MLWTSNICRICARISEICIPVFQEGITSSVESKIRRCLNTTVAKDDLKPKQVCEGCFVKLNEFYDFIALFHDSNYRFETLLYQSSQEPTADLQDCVDRNLPAITNPTKSEVLPDCSSLGLIVEYKDEILPLENLDVQARDFGESNILNEIVEEASVSNGVDMNHMQNFVCNGEEIYGENLTILRNSNDSNYLGKLRHLQSYLDGENVSEYVKPTEVMIKSDSNIIEQNDNFEQTVYPENIIINNNNKEIKVRNNNNIVSKKRNSKLTIISVDTVRRAVEHDKQMKELALLNKSKQIHSVAKTESVEEHNILTKIGNDAQDVEIDNIDVENLVTNDTQTYTEKIDSIELDYLTLQQNIKNAEKSDKSTTDPLALDNCGFKPHCYVENINNDIKIKKKRTTLNIISVATIRKMIENRPQVEIVPRRARMKIKNNKNEMKSKLDQNKSRFPCQTCGKTFARRQHFNEHMKKHNNIRPYVCDICDKTFAVQWDLTFHKRVHTDLYSCEHCTKCFSAPSKLTRHIRTHTGERPFACPVKDCGRSFSDKRNLIGHEITHTNIRKFTCDICKRSYKTKSQLKDHMQAHSEWPAFKCSNCDKSYKWKTNLLMHMKKHECFGNASVSSMHRKECKKETNEATNT